MSLNLEKYHETAPTAISVVYTKWGKVLPNIVRARNRMVWFFTVWCSQQFFFFNQFLSGTEQIFAHRWTKYRNIYSYLFIALLLNGRISVMEGRGVKRKVNDIVLIEA